MIRCSKSTPYCSIIGWESNWVFVVFKWVWKSLQNRLCKGFAFCLRLASLANKFCFYLAFRLRLRNLTNRFCWFSCFQVAFRKPNKRVLLFLSCLKSHLRSRTNVAADSGGRLINIRRTPSPLNLAFGTCVQKIGQKWVVYKAKKEKRARTTEIWDI